MVALDEKVATPMDEAELENGKGGEEEEEEEEEEDEAEVGVPYAATWTHLSRARLLSDGRTLLERGASHPRNSAEQIFFLRGATLGRCRSLHRPCTPAPGCTKPG